MPWINLALAGILEIGWAIGLKYTAGFTRLWPSVWTIIAMIFSFYFLSQSLKYLPIGTAYAVWTGIGAAGTALLGIYLFNEPVAFLRLFCIALIIIAIIGLKISVS